MKEKAAICIGIIAALVFAVSVVQICRICIEGGLRSRAQSLAVSGRYGEAAEIYERLGDDSAAADSRALESQESYQQAVSLLQQGDTAGAAKLFSSISQYRDAADYLIACGWQEALEAQDTEKLLTARSVFAKLGSHSYCTQALEQINSLLLEQAKERAQAPDLSGALEILDKLGSYKGSDILAERCRKMLDWVGAPEGGRLLTEERRYMPDKLENVYLCDEAYIVVPEVLDSSTGFFIYFPGGRDEEMSVDYLLYYMMNPSPNTLAVFMRRNGLEDMEAKTGRAVEILDRAAAECGLFPRDVVTAGSSLGAYPAMHFAYYAWKDHALRTDCVLSLDAGSDWMENWLLLGEEQCRALAELGTDFYLFESPWVGMNREGICRMVNAGDKVTMVGCYFDDHVRISLDAMGMGVVDWAVNDRSRPCNPDIYTFVTLHPGDEDKWD